MEPTEEQLRITYRNMSTNELLDLCQSGTLTTMAQAFASIELTSRGVAAEEISKRVIPEKFDYGWKVVKTVWVGGVLSVGGMFLLGLIPGIPNSIPYAWLMITCALIVLRSFYWLFKF